MESDQVFAYDYACYKMNKIKGIRYAGIVSNRGRKVAGGFNNKVVPLENDRQKIEMLLMEMSLDLSMRKEFNQTLGNIRAIVSYRDKINLITIPYKENFLLLSSDPELDPLEAIKIANDILATINQIEVEAH